MWCRKMAITDIDENRSLFHLTHRAREIHFRRNISSEQLKIERKL